MLREIGGRTDENVRGVNECYSGFLSSLLFALAPLRDLLLHHAQQQRGPNCHPDSLPSSYLSCKLIISINGSHSGNIELTV